MSEPRLFEVKQESAESKPKKLAKRVKKSKREDLGSLRRVRIQPDITALAQSFDYAVPENWSEDKIRLGARVRIRLHGRRVGGWITEIDPPNPAEVDLKKISHWSGLGPNEDVIELARYAAYRWAGSVVHGLRAASPSRNVYSTTKRHLEVYNGPVVSWASDLFDKAGATAEIAPCSDRWPIVQAAWQKANPILLMPTVQEAKRLAERLDRASAAVALMPQQWRLANSGAIVVGTASAIWAPAYKPGAIVVFDEHDDVWRAGKAPTWHTRQLAAKRAELLDIPCVFVSPAPSAAAVQLFPVKPEARSQQHAGWPKFTIIDRTEEPPGRLGLFSEHASRAMAKDTSAPASPARPKVAAILNRLGRVKVLACGDCGSLTRCEICDSTMETQKAPQQESGLKTVSEQGLKCSRCGNHRPKLCASCGSMKLKNLVLAISKAREELASLINEPVGEIQKAASEMVDARVVIGTQALLRTPVNHRERHWNKIIFLDIDQHLLAPRQTAEIETLTLFVLAARHLGPRANQGEILVQTRQPGHPLLQAMKSARSDQMTELLLKRAQEMQWPPNVAQAVVSGQGASDFMAEFGQPEQVLAMGPDSGSWMLRSKNHDALYQALADTKRPKQRLRIEVS